MPEGLRLNVGSEGVPGLAGGRREGPVYRAGSPGSGLQNLDIAKKAFIFSFVSRSRAESVRTSVQSTA